MNMIAVRREPGRRDHGDDSAASGDGAQMLRRLYTIALRRWRAVIVVTTAIFALVCVVGMLQPRTYTASALVMINPSKQQVLQQGQMIDADAPNSALVDSEIEVLRSPALARRVVLALELNKDAAWNSDPAAAATPELIERVASDLEGAISIRRRGQSFTIDVLATSHSPLQAAQIANSLVDLYLRTRVEGRFESAREANVWLKQRLDDLRTEVAVKERAAEEFRQAQGLSVAVGGAEQPQTTDMQNTMVQARADLAEKEARLRLLSQLGNTGASIDAIVALVQTPMLQQLQTQEQTLRAEQADLSQNYGERHPAVVKNQGELIAVRQRIQQEVERILPGLRNETEISRTRLRTLQDSFGVTSGVLGQNNDAVIQYRELLRDAEAARAVYTNFLERSHELADQGQLPAAAATIVSTAAAPSAPSSPNMRTVWQIALLLALAAGLGAAVLLELLDTTVASAEEVERHTGLYTIASIPRLSAVAGRFRGPSLRDPARYIVKRPLSGFAEAFRVLRAAILQAPIEGGARVVAITSAVPGEGKTTISTCLARISAMAGERVILLNCDLRRQAMQNLAAMEAAARAGHSNTKKVAPPPGIVDVLEGGVAWSEAVTIDADSTAHSMSPGNTLKSATDFFSSPAMRALLGELRSHYDLIILDCAPILAVAETRILVAHADLVLLTVNGNKTAVEAVQNAVRQVEASNSSVYGVALNCIDPRAPGRRSYGDSLYYAHAKTYYHA